MNEKNVASTVGIILICESLIFSDFSNQICIVSHSSQSPIENSLQTCFFMRHDNFLWDITYIYYKLLPQKFPFQKSVSHKCALSVTPDQNKDSNHKWQKHQQEECHISTEVIIIVYQNISWIFKAILPTFLFNRASTVQIDYKQALPRITSGKTHTESKLMLPQQFRLQKSLSAYVRWHQTMIDKSIDKKNATIYRGKIIVYQKIFLNFRSEFTYYPIQAKVSIVNRQQTSFSMSHRKRSKEDQNKYTY